jgi:hypothetical protein
MSLPSGGESLGEGEGIEGFSEGMFLFFTNENNDRKIPFSPTSGPATGSFNGLHRESNFLAI